MVDNSFYRAQVEHELRAKLLRLRQKASGMLSDADLPNPECDDDDPGGVVADLVASFPASSRASVCEADYSPFLADAVSVIADSCANFVPPG